MIRAGAAIAIGALPLTSCTNAATCDCADPSVTINVPADVASSVTGVGLTGPACAGVTLGCTNATNGCTSYRFVAAAPGSCHVEVGFATGATFTADIALVASTGCCTGFYASPLSAAQIDVPEPGDGGPT